MSVLWRKCWFRDLSFVFVLAQKRTWIIQLSSIIHFVKGQVVLEWAWMRLPFPRCSLAVAFGSWDDWNWLGSWKLVLSSSTEASWLELEPSAPEKKGRQRGKDKKQPNNSAILVRQFSIPVHSVHSAENLKQKSVPLNLSGSAAIRFESDGPRLHQRLRQNLQQTKWKFPAFVLGEVNWWMTFFWMFPQNNETFCWWWFF